MPVSPVRILAAAIILAVPAPVPHLVAQDSTGRTDTASTPPLPPSPSPSPLAPAAPLPPTPEQLRYLQGLRTVARGVAQLRDGIGRVSRTQQRSDTTQQRLAGRRLGGLCTTARSFISSGRPRMQPTAYEDSMRLVARQLVVRIDTVFKFLPTCETTAGKQPVSVAADLLNRLRAYETALATFRAGLTSPNRVDSTKTPSQQED